MSKKRDDEDLRDGSSSVLRCQFAQRLLVDRGLNPRVAMLVGGWDSFQAIDSYRNEPTPGIMNAAFAEAGLV